MQSTLRQRLLASTLLIGAAAFATPAWAQPAEDTQEPVSSEQGEADQADILVTGSRIARNVSTEATSPVAVVGEAEIEQSGAARIEDLTNQLPQVQASQTAFVSNGASGTATVDLRGLGAARTLVLVNGRRLQPGSPGFPVADLNQIPASLVERIEVMTGGASSVYGADAVSGVVNFIMNTRFEGFRLDAQYSFYQHENRNDQIIDTVGSDNFTIRDRMDQRRFTYPTGNVVDGQAFDATVTFGVSTEDGRGRLVAYAGYREVEPILQGRRDHSSCALSRTGAGRIICGGSFTTPQGVIVDPSFGGFFFAEPDGAGGFRNFSGAYNYAPVNYFQRPDERWTAGLFASYEAMDFFKPYAEFMFMDDRSLAQIAESGTFFADQINIRCDSPLLTPQQGAELCASIDGQTGAGDDPVPDGIVPIFIGKRNVEGGPRVDDLRHTAFRTVVGARGDVASDWSYDISGQYGTTIFAETYRNDISRSRLRNSLDAAVVGGQVVCAINADATTSNDDPTCSPYNPFQGPGIVTDPRRGITQSALNYILTPGFQRGETEEFIVNGFLTGSLFNLYATDPVSLVVGGEYRREEININVDTAFSTGDLAGQGGPQPNVSGSFNVKEAFAELLVPIISDQPLFEQLSLELGYRYSDYSLGFNTDTYKVAAVYSPVPDIRFRGGYNRAVRAPNVLNLFTPNRLALFSGSDPCAGATPRFTLQQCQRTGVTPGQYGSIPASPADQYNQIIGGNPNVEPEVADTWTVGAAIEPRFVPGLAITVDYFNIQIANAIGGIGAQTILEQCGLTGEATFCNLIRRNPLSGDLWVGSDQSSPNVGRVTNTTLNIGGIETSGIDIGLNYSRQIGPGRARIDFNGTWLDELIVDTGIASGVAGADGRYDCAGFTGSVCGFPYPEWRHVMRVGYTFPDGIGVSVRWRHFGSVEFDQFSSDPDLSTATAPDARGSIASQNYFDLTLNFDVSDNYRMLLGVNNLLDRDPPLRPASFGTDNANTWAGTYDPVGRYIFVSGTLRF